MFILYLFSFRRLLERSGRARQILFECLSYFKNVNSYPLLLMLSHQKDRIVLLDIVNGNCDLDQTRACLERTLNPVLEQSIISINEVNLFVFFFFTNKIFINSFNNRQHLFHQVGLVVVQQVIFVVVLLS
jgi:hypothetical protein